MHRWARLGSGAVLPRDGKGCVQRGACHPSRSESPRWAWSRVGGGRLSAEGHPAARRLCRVKMAVL